MNLDKIKSLVTELEEAMNRDEINVSAIETFERCELHILLEGAANENILPISEALFKKIKPHLLAETSSAVDDIRKELIEELGGTVKGKKKSKKSTKETKQPVVEKVETEIKKEADTDVVLEEAPAVSVKGKPEPGETPVEEVVETPISEPVEEKVEEKVGETPISKPVEEKPKPKKKATKVKRFAPKEVKPLAEGAGILIMNGANKDVTGYTLGVVKSFYDGEYGNDDFINHLDKDLKQIHDEVIPNVPAGGLLALRDMPLSAITDLRNMYGGAVLTVFHTDPNLKEGNAEYAKTMHDIPAETNSGYTLDLQLDPEHTGDGIDAIRPYATDLAYDHIAPILGFVAEDDEEAEDDLGIDV